MNTKVQLQRGHKQHASRCFGYRLITACIRNIIEYYCIWNKEDDHNNRFHYLCMGVQFTISHYLFKKIMSILQINRQELSIFRWLSNHWSGNPRSNFGKIFIIVKILMDISNSVLSESCLEIVWRKYQDKVQSEINKIMRTQ